jgi:hypothetical protein
VLGQEPTSPTSAPPSTTWPGAWARPCPTWAATPPATPPPSAPAPRPLPRRWPPPGS